MKSIRTAFFAFAFTLLAALAGAASAAPTERPHDGYAFAGKVDDHGAWTERHFAGLPSALDAVRADAPFAIHVECSGTIVASQGTKLRIESSPRAAEIGRIKIGASVQCLELTTRYGIVWAKVTAPPDSLAFIMSGCLIGDDDDDPKPLFEWTDDCSIYSSETCHMAINVTVRTSPRLIC